MATTIVRHRGNRGIFAVVGAGYGQWAFTQHRAFGWPYEVKGNSTMLVVCDRHGTLGEFPAEDLEVMSIDGVTPREAISKALDEFGDPPAEAVE